MSDIVTAPYPNHNNTLLCTTVLDTVDNACRNPAPWVEADKIAGSEMHPEWMGEAWCDMHRPENLYSEVALE